MMKHRIFLPLLAILFFVILAYARQRVIVLTDIENDPDDRQSIYAD
jgi:hypothetical protein